jgi:hypothetical protein
MSGNQLGKRLKAAPAKTRPTQRDLGWAAGFYEGEGSAIFVARSHRVAINQVEREPLERILSLFGGHIFAVPAHRRSKPSWRWYACGARARGILLTLYPMLSAKRQSQIRKVIAAGEVRTQRWS